MTVVNRLPFPTSQLLKSDGMPAAGWTYTFYLSGTSTLASVYTAVDLTGPTNALVLNAYGMPDVDIFLDPDVNYKLVITDTTAATIFTYNNVRDFARRAIAHFTIYAGNPNGNVAGTAGVVGGSPADAIFDTTNSIVWVCTTTGTAGTAVWTNVTSALSGAISFTGVLTPASFSTQQDNYNPTDLATASTVRFNPGADSDVTGLTGGASGREITLINTNATYRVNLRNENASSSAANRFLLANGLDVALLPNYLCVISYDSLTARWRLKVPPLAIPLGHGSYISNATISCTVGSSALTISLKTARGNDPSPADPIVACFRNATVATGDYAYRTVTAATSLVISSGSTLGTANATPFKIWIVLFDDGGTVRIGVINCVKGGATPTAIFRLGGFPTGTSFAEGGAGAADAAYTFYTGTAVTAKAYAILGYCSYESGLATAGTWSAVPTRVQLYGPHVPLPGDTVNSLFCTTTTTAVGTPNLTKVDISGWSDSPIIGPSSATHLVNIRLIGNQGSTASGGGYVSLFRGTNATLIGNLSTIYGSGGFTVNSPVICEARELASASSITYGATIVSTTGNNDTFLSTAGSIPAGTGILIIKEISS